MIFSRGMGCTLNCDITIDEIAQVMRRLKHNKSTGLDGIKAKFLLDVGDMLHVSLEIVFNKLLQQGYSASLSTRVIHALHKGGDPLQFENYRGITVGPILAKVFAMILEAQLSNWVEERGLCANGQVGFRKDFRTTDNMYILRTLIEQSTHKCKKVYCCFVDFCKAFDTVPRDLLWQVLAKMGIVGRSCSVYRTCTTRTLSELCIQQKGYQPGSHVALGSNKVVH